MARRSKRKSVTKTTKKSAEDSEEMVHDQSDAATSDDNAVNVKSTEINESGENADAASELEKEVIGDAFPNSNVDNDTVFDNTSQTDVAVAPAVFPKNESDETEMSKSLPEQDIINLNPDSSVQTNNESSLVSSPSQKDAVATPAESLMQTNVEINLPGTSVGESTTEGTGADVIMTIPDEENLKKIDLTQEDEDSNTSNNQETIFSKNEKDDNEENAATETMDLCSDEAMPIEDKANEDSNDSSVIEIGTPIDSTPDPDKKSDKEAVVIELSTNDHLNDANDNSEKIVSPGERSTDFKVVDEIDLTKSDDEKMDVGEVEQPTDPEKDYVVPNYDDPALVDLDKDPEQDNGQNAEETKEFLRYWNPVQENPQEFTSWTYLLQYVEQEGDLPLARRSFNSFFARYPLCYGYWKKFSELERRNGNVLRAQKILERGVRAIPLSVDLWVHVIDYYINHYSRPDAGVDKVRAIFERAISAAGQEFRSEKLWNKYVKWEVENKDWLRVMAIYDKAVRALTQHYSILFGDFKSFVNKHSPNELLSQEEFAKLLSEVRKDASVKSPKKDTDPGAEAEAEAKTEAETKEESNVEAEAEPKAEDDETKKEDVDDAPLGISDDEKPVMDEELKAVRARIIEEKKKVHDETEQLVTKIWAFEEGIKRPYFHVKQLERAQLKNWREYLDVEIGRDNQERVILLFERCLIACALYEDFWLKYTKYLSRYDAEKTSKIFERACMIHLPKKPNIHIQWAAHEETQGNRQKAIEIIENLDKILPGMAMIRMRRVALHRRAGDFDAAEKLFRTYIASSAKDKEEIFYSRKMAWFFIKIANKKEEGKKIIKDLISKYKAEVKLYSDLIEMEFQCAGPDYPVDENEEGLAMEAFNMALSSEKLNDEQKFVFSQRKLEFLEDFGRDVKHLQKVYDDHQKMLRSHKKRAHIDLTADETPNKKPKVDNTSIAVVGTSQLSNGATYTVPVATTTAYAAQQAGYASTDPSLYYQQQQSYWNYAKPGDSQTQQQYNYSQQWSQYYGAQR